MRCPIGQLWFESPLLLTTGFFFHRSTGMLVLSRKKDESIRIGDDVVVTIIEIRGDKVRVAIDAPRDIPVHRQEVYEAIRAESEARDS